MAVDITREAWNRTQDEITKLKAQIDSMYFADGETLTIKGTVPLAGYITTTSKDLRFFVPVGKSVKNINAVLLTEMNGLIRGANGYLNGNSVTTDWMSISGLTFSVSVIDERTLLLAVSSQTAFTNATNNTPLTFSPNVGLTLKFEV